MIIDAYKNPADPTMADATKCLATMKKHQPVGIKTAMKWLGIVPHPNYCCPQIVHLPVLQQFRGTLCGFHTLFNAKCMARALITDSRYTQLLSLCQLNSDREFWLHYSRTIKLLLDCENKYYVNEQDKREL